MDFDFITYSLIAGSLLILVAARFLVSPIKKLTIATKRIADGDFSVKLNIKQKDELGTLARSFEEMTHDLQQLEQLRRNSYQTCHTKSSHRSPRYPVMLWRSNKKTSRFIIGYVISTLSSMKRIGCPR